MAVGGGLFVEVGLMLVEGRVPNTASGNVLKQGPHCPQLSSAYPTHDCSEDDFVCIRAATLRRHMTVLRENKIQMCLDVYLCPDCSCGQARASATNICGVASSNDLLLEQWTVSILNNKPNDCLEVNNKGLFQALRSQLHFSQLASWYSLGKGKPVCYRLSYKGTANPSVPNFTRPPTEHTFPVVIEESGAYIKVTLKSLPRLESVPTVNCSVHDTNYFPLSGTVTAVKSVFAELGHCLLDPPSRIPSPLRQGFTVWRDNKTPLPSRNKNFPRNIKPPARGLSVLDDRLQSCCNHIGKHHCEDDSDQDSVQKATEESKQSGCVIQNDLITYSKRNDGQNNICKCSSTNSFISTENNKASIILSNVLQSNPLKRKRQQLNHNSKKLLSESNSRINENISVIYNVKQCNIDLVDSFNKLKIRDVTNTFPSTQCKNITKNVPLRYSNNFKTPPLPHKISPCTTDSSSEDTECESPVNLKPFKLNPSSSSFLLYPKPFGLLGNFEESILKGRIKPIRIVEGFSADIGASGSFCPEHRKVPVKVSYFPPQGYSAPYMGLIQLDKKGYSVPRCGTLQVTLFNPDGTVIKIFVVGYDLSDMPANSQTFVRQRTVSVAAENNNNNNNNNNLSAKFLRYLVNLRFYSSKSGNSIYLHSDIQMILCRQYEVNSTRELDLESSNNLHSYLITPTNPKYSTRIK